MKHLLACLLPMLIGIILALPTSPAAEDEGARLDTFFKEYLEEMFRQAPLEASRLGDHRFDHLLDDLTPKARAARTAHARKTLETLPKRVDYDKLSRSAQIDFEIFRQHLTRTVMVGREHTSVRGRPACLQRLHQRQCLPAANTIDSAPGDQHQE